MILLELKMALRRLRRGPVRSLAVVVTLALGVGTTTVAFAAIDAVLWRELPVERQDELIVAWRTSERTSIRLPFSGIAFDALRRGAASLSAVAGYSAWGALPVLVETPDDSYSLSGSYVAGDFFGVLGARPALGRLLTPADDEPGATPAVVLSHSAWRTRYGSEPTVVGSTLIVGGHTATVVGVAPEGLEYPRGTEMWYPLRADYANAPADGHSPELHLVGRMAAGVDPATVVADVAATLAADAQASSFLADSRSVLRGFVDEVVGSVEPVLRAALAAAVVLLLAAAANAILFLLAGGRQATHEMAVRAALGAERTQLLSRLLADSAVVAVVACSGGIALAWVALAALTPLAPPELPRLDAVTLGTRAVCFGMLLSAMLALATGLLAGWVMSRRSTPGALSSGSRGSASGRSAFRRMVAGFQIALAVVSAAGAGLLVRSVAALNTLDPGFSAQDMTAVSLWIPYSWFNVPREYLRALEEVMADLESRPGVVAARPTLGPPLEQRLEVALRAEGQSDEEVSTNPAVAVDAVLPGHFGSLGIPVRSGRGFTEADNRPGANPVVVVDEVLARALWPGADPIGQRIIGYPGLGGTSFTVVGVVAATRYRELLVAHPRAYFPLQRLGNSPPAALLVRTEEPSVPVRALVAQAFASADPSVRVLDARRLTDALREPTVGRRFATVVLVSFAGVTLLLALLGVYGVFTILVQERTREMGIRRALGAQRWSIIRIVLAGVLGVAAMGAVTGLLGSLWATRLLQSLVYGVAPTDPATLSVVVAACVALALAAGLSPALRASSVDPAVSLRSD